jgi:hypothetical protein
MADLSEDYHRYIGFWIGENHFLEKQDYLKAVELDQFDPDESFTQIYENFIHKNQPSRLTSMVEFTIHLSNINGILSQSWFFDSFWSTHKKYAPKFSLSVHIPFAEHQLPLTTEFVPTLLDSLKFCEKIEAGAMVIHAPRTKEDTSEAFIEQLTNPSVITQLKQYPMFISIENTQDSGCYFQKMEHLVTLRLKLIEKLQQISAQDLISCFTFCFDTGHYLLYQQRDGHLNSDFDEWSSSFLPLVSVIHIHANDGSRDQHILPYLQSSYPEERYPFDFKQYFENCHQVIRWLKLIDEQWAPELNGKRYHVLETYTPYSWDEMAAFWEKWAKKIMLL